MVDRRKVESRNEAFVSKTATKIWHEIPNDNNPYIAESVECHGYDLFELLEKRSFVDVFFLIFRGELPDKYQAALLEALMIALINPGPRHPATRAALNTAVGKSDPMHILPVGISVLGGKFLGGANVSHTMRFFRKHSDARPDVFIKDLMLNNAAQPPNNSDPADTIDESSELVPGFGQYFGGLDKIAHQLAQTLHRINPSGPALSWGIEIDEILNKQGIGWLITGVAAATLSDLGFHPRAGGCLFQLLGAPGLAAHGIELCNKPFTAMPFVKDEDYVIE